jgi:repressor LexA
MDNSAPKLTHRQAEILAFIEAHIHAHSRPPTRAEIAVHFRFSVAASAQEHLQALAKKGYIALEAGLSRGLKLLKSADGSERVTPARPRNALSYKLPLIGEVRAGMPMLAAEHIEQEIAVPNQLFSPKADFLLRVRGDSMCNAGILAGDYLSVHKTSQARSGQIIVARIGDEVTVKTLRLSATQVILEPANPAYKPLSLALSDPNFAIEGVVVGVIRRLNI